MDVLPSFKKEEVTLETEEQIIDPVVEVEPPVIKSPVYNDTPETTPGMHRSSQVRVKTNQDHIPSMLGKQHENTNTQVEYKETFHPDAKMIFCQ